MELKYLSKKEKGIGINDIRIKLAALHDIILKSNFDENLYRGIMQTKQELSRCIENLSSLKNHNTPKSLRAYCLLFIYIFPYSSRLSIVDNIQHVHNILYILHTLPYLNITYLSIPQHTLPYLNIPYHTLYTLTYIDTP